MLTLYAVLATLAIGSATPTSDAIPAPVHIALSNNRGNGLSKRDGAGQLLSGLSFSTYFGLDMDIGTPSQRLSATVVIGGNSGKNPNTPSKLLLGLNGGDQRKRAAGPVDGQSYFIPDNSSSFTLSSDTAPLFPASNLTGTVAHDVVILNGITLPKQELVMVQPQQVPDLLWGALGRDYAAIGLDPTSDLAHDLLQSRAAEMGLFLAPINKDSPTTAVSAFYDHNAGELTIGGLNQQLYTGEVNYIPLVTDSEWRVALGGIKIGGNGNVVDIGTGLSATAKIQARNTILMEESLANRTMAQVPGSRYTVRDLGAGYNTTMYSVPCDTNTTISVTLGGQDYAVPPTSWVGGLYNNARPDEDCVGLIVPMPSQPGDVEVILGHPFLSNVYTALKFGNGTETPQLGFASLSDAARSVVPERIEASTKPTGSMPGYSVLPRPTVTADASSAARNTAAVSGLVVGLAAICAFL